MANNKKAPPSVVVCSTCRRSFPREDVKQVNTSGRGGRYYLCRPCAALVKQPTPVP